jgi:hypothetical protein
MGIRFSQKNRSIGRRSGLNYYRNCTYRGDPVLFRLTSFAVAVDPEFVGFAIESASDAVYDSGTDEPFCGGPFDVRLRRDFC